MESEVIVSRSNPLQRSRPDVATLLARFALACVVVGGLLWGAFADAADVGTCTVETAPGAGCGGSGGTQEYMDEALVTSQAIFVCRVAVTAGSDWPACVDGESNPAYEYLLPASLSAGDWVWFSATGYALFEETSFFEGGEEPPETTPSWVPELAVEDAVKLWGAALMLLVIGFVGAILRRAMSLR
jgi:hypothetical protein